VKRLLLITVVLLVLPTLDLAQSHRGRRVQSARKQTDAKFLNAIEKGDLATFYSLLKHGANVNARGFAATTALMNAALNNQTEFLVALISKGARVNARNAFGNTALMDAAASGQLEMVRWLLIAGANTNAKNESDWTALMLATKSAYAQQPNYQRVIELLKTAEAKKKR